MPTLDALDRRRPARPGGVRLGPTPTVAVAAVVALAVSACDEAPTPTEAGPRAEPATEAATAWQGSVRGDAAVEVTRLLARALGNPGLRNRV